MTAEVIPLDIVPVTVAFDVDGCLLSAIDDRPLEDVRTLLVTLHTLGCHVVLWSGGGELHARMAARRAGVAHAVDGYAAKGAGLVPDIAVDDQPVTLGRVNIRIP